MSAAKTLVFLPGLDGTEVFFQPLIRSLPKSICSRVACFPTAGSNEYVDLLKIVQRAVAGVPEYYIAAWSFSGPLALMLANAEPAKVRGVILFASFVRAPLRVLPVLRFGAIAPVIGAIRVARRIPVWIGHRRSDPLRRAKADLWKRIDAAVLAKRVRTIIAADARDGLRHCNAPILYVAGNRDRVVPRRNADEIVKIKPSVRLRTIGGGHFAIYKNPQASAAAIQEFVFQVVAGSHLTS